jgi:hypothetical protein
VSWISVLLLAEHEVLYFVKVGLRKPEDVVEEMCVDKRVNLKTNDAEHNTTRIFR